MPRLWVSAPLVLLLLPGGAVAETLHWVVKQEHRSPDCVDAVVVTTNGEFPGPTIRVQPGELLEVYVENHMLSTALSIHWHGQQQMGTSWQDGTTMVSSCPIPPMSSWTYRFNVNDHPGTYQYHAHIGAVRLAGMGGSLIVEGAVSPYAEDVDGEFTVNAMDWFHAGVEQMTGMKMGHRWAGGPQNVLVNGKGYFNCSEESVEAPWWRPVWHEPQCHSDNCPGLESFDVDQGKTYLLRFIHGGSLTLMNFAIEHHNMTVVEVDGYPTEPYATQFVELNAGQRIGVLVTMDQSPGVYAIRVRTVDQGGNIFGYALLSYADVAAVPTYSQLEALSIEQPVPPDSSHSWSFGFQNGLRGLYNGSEGIPPVPGSDEVERRFVMLVSHEDLPEGQNHNVDLSSVSLDSLESQVMSGPDAADSFCGDDGDATHWCMARRTYTLSSTPVMSKLYFGIGAEDVKEDNGYYEVGVGKIYDVVVQMSKTCYGSCPIHAWHLHGSHFWFLGSFRGEWTGSDEQLSALNVADPPFRDTVHNVPEDVDDRGMCGYVVLRFRVDSPGVWPFHCHHFWDFAQGLGSTFYTTPDGFPEPPDNLMVCGDMTIKSVADKLSEPSGEVDGATCRFASAWLTLLVSWVLLRAAGLR